VSAPLVLWLLLLLGGVVWDAAASAADAAASAAAEKDAPIPKSEYRRVPGTHVSMPRPKGFVLADDFLGFRSIRGVGTITVAEVPQPYDELKSYSDEVLGDQEWDLVSREPVTIDRRKGELIVATQTLPQGLVIQRWVAIFGTPRRWVMISASCPQSAASHWEPEFRRALLHARWRSVDNFDPFEDLGFTLRGDYDLQFALRGVDQVTFTKDGFLPLADDADPALVIKVAQEKVPEEERRAYCVEQLKGSTILEKGRVIAANATELDGLPGCEALAQGAQTGSGSPLVVYQAAVFGPRHVYLFGGRVGLRFRDVWLSRIRHMVALFKRR
jgi:hypothetical protein